MLLLLLLLVESVDNLAKAYMNFVQRVAAGSVGTETLLHGNAHFVVSFAELILRGAWRHMQLAQQPGSKLLLLLYGCVSAPVN
jgi:hypothetical protein